MPSPNSGAKTSPRKMTKLSGNFYAKLMFLGDEGVGVTATHTRVRTSSRSPTSSTNYQFVELTFPETYDPTPLYYCYREIGIDGEEFHVEVEDLNMLRDLETARDFLLQYYAAVVFVYSITSLSMSVTATIKPTTS